MKTENITNNGANPTPEKKNKFALILGSIVLALLALTTISSIIVATSTRDTVINGISVEGQPVNGLTRDELKAFVQDKVQTHIDKSTINLNYDNQSWCIKPSDIDVAIDTNSVIEAAYQPGHSDSLIQNIMDNMEYALHNKDLNFNISYDPNKLDSALLAVAQDIYRDPVNADCYLNSDGSVGHDKAISGQQLNTEDLAASIEKYLLDFNMPDNIVLEPIITPPYITDKDVESIDSILASYTTTFYEGNYERSQNIRIAANSISGVLVKPMQEFSFNDTVGHRTADNGYLTAPVIIGNKVEQDFGGGVCQVSSTLYNAILNAGLTSTERSNHSLASSYVPLGQDATVADNLLDFKFRNPLAHSVYLIASCYSGNMTVLVLGCYDDLQGKTYHVRNHVDGEQVSVYRSIYQNGEEIEREYLHTDTYSKPEPEPEPDSDSNSDEDSDEESDEE